MTNFVADSNRSKFLKKEVFAVDHFELVAPYAPTGDQPEAIAKLTEGVENGLKEQVLLGVTGSGKTFTMANIIANVNRLTLVLAHNKTLAAQLCSEFREFFPNNTVEYFRVSVDLPCFVSETLSHSMVYEKRWVNTHF